MLEANLNINFNIMKNLNNSLFNELKDSKITKKSMSITKGGTTTSDACSTKPGLPINQDK